MRRLAYFIINLAISGFILWISPKIFPEQIHIKDFGTLVAATVLLWLATIAISAIGAAAAGGGVILRSCGWTILGVLIMLGAKILALYALSAWLPGFSIDGFWLKVLIAFVGSLFAISRPKSSANNNRDNP